MSGSRPPSVDKIVSRFQRASDPKRRYEQLLWFAKKLDPMPDADKVSDNKVPGCVSQVFVTAHLQDGAVIYQADSDAQITKGLVAMLIQALNGLSPSDIVNLSPDFIQETQLSVSLTPSRANGFYNIFKTMQKKALALMDGAPAGAEG